MCVIIDANVWPAFCADPTAATLSEVDRWLTSGKGRVVYGGTKYGEELAQVAAAVQLLFSYAQAGMAKKYPDGPIDTDAARLKQDPQTESNDHHILALARVSGARILCTGDKALMSDFTNRSLVPTPRGRVFPGDGWNFKLDHRGPCGVRTRR